MNLNGFFQTEVDIENIPVSQLDGVLSDVGRTAPGSVERRRFIAKIKSSARRATVSVGKETAKSKFEKRFPMLPKDVQKDLLNGKLQIVDSMIYSTKIVGGVKQMDLFDNADVAQIGLQNITQRQLEKDRPFLITGIILTSGVGAAGAEQTKEAASAVNFTTLPATIANGEIKIEVGKTTILDAFPMAMFKGTHEDTGLLGYHELHNPKFIEPERDIEALMETSGIIVADTFMKIMFVGVTVEKR